MNWTLNVIWCAGCGVEITWGAYISKGYLYCCKDCSEGRPCQCGERMELDDEHRIAQSTIGK